MIRQLVRAMTQQTTVNGNPLKYQWYQAVSESTAPMRTAADAFLQAIDSPDWEPARSAAAAVRAACELVALAGLTHARPRFALGTVNVEGRDRAVREEVIWTAPFVSLRRFTIPDLVSRPCVLLLAPLSGHFSTQLRDTVCTLLADHDVVLTDWHNARDVACSEGRFGLDEYVSHVIRFLELVGPGTHVISISQATVAALAAASLMAEDNHPARPRTLTLIGGPIDTRIGSSAARRFALEHSAEWCAENLISTVPAPYPGAGRDVYPAFVQFGSAIGREFTHHLKSFAELYNHRMLGKHGDANAIRNSYAEYLATMDLPAEFFLETTDQVFRKHALASGRLKVGDRRVDPRAISDTALLTIEGAIDPVCPLGQTQAAHRLCASLPARMRLHHVQPDADHYGTFTGREWQQGIYPLVRSMTRKFK